LGVARRPETAPEPSPPSGGDEATFLAGYDASAYPPVGVTVDVVVLTIRQGQLCVLLVRRGTHPYKGDWALPGGFVMADESLDEAARRELIEETSVDAAPWHLEQLRTYGDPGRDPRLRVVSVGYLGLMPDLPRPLAGTDAADARFWPVADLAAKNGPTLAFDHDTIVADGIERARAKLEYTTLATAFVEQPFTIAELRRVYEAVWGVSLHAANFRRKVLATPGFVEATGDERATGRGWAELYRAAQDASLHPAMLRPAETDTPTAPKPATRKKR
jgi:8-oxo-dGTP diphosphatase